MIDMPDEALVLLCCCVGTKQTRAESSFEVSNYHATRKRRDL
jgi:hypothetical protein